MQPLSQQINDETMYGLVTTATPQFKLAVAIIPGWCATSYCHKRLALALAPYFKVYVPDLLGFGKSSKPRHVPTNAQQADAVATWLQQSGVQRVAVIGHSLGCEIAVAMAGHRPNFVAKTVLLSPAPDLQTPSILRHAWRFAKNSPREPLSYMPILTWSALQAGVRHSFVAARQSLHDDMLTTLPHLVTPTLVVRGDRDVMTPASWADHIYHALPHGSLATVPGAAHNLHFSHPTQVAALAVKFLA